MAKGFKGGPNQKAVAGNAKKAEAQAKKDAEAARQREAEQQKEWSAGANLRQSQREAEAAAKADEAARKRREKAELLAQEEASLATGGKAKINTEAAAKQKKNKKKDDLSLLEDALQKDAAKQVRLKREDLLKKKEEEDAHLNRKELEKPMDPLLVNTESMLGPDAGRHANLQRMEDNATSGIDAALSHLNVSGSGGDEIKSPKALYNQFEARMLPVVKEEYPGLRLTQYKEKVWNLWKKSPENPANQVPLSS